MLELILNINNRKEAIMLERKLYSRFNRPCHSGIKFIKPSKTDESYYSDVNIHSIRMRGMNCLPKNSTKPIYGVNLCEVGGLQESFNVQSSLKNSFNEFPESIRKRFNNNPEELLSFVSNREANYEEGLKLGLFSPDKKPTVFEQNISTIAEFFNKQSSNATPAVIPTESE